MYRKFGILLAWAGFLFINGCGGGGGDSVPAPPPVVEKAVAYTDTGSSIQIDHVSTPETDSSDLVLSYTLNLSAPKDVFLVFTNQTETDLSSPPAIYGKVAGESGTQQFESALFDLTDEQWAGDHGVGLRGKSEVTLFNSSSKLRAALEPAVSALVMDVAPPQPLFDAVSDTDVFYSGLANTGGIAATCRKVVTDGTKTLNIWVENVSWTATCARNNCVDQTMVDDLAAKFLTAGADNDIYDWVTNIYGEEWGAHGAGNLIAPDNNITILLYDIDADNSTNGGVIGFFYSKDNYTSYSGSNQRVMFYIDSVMYATPEDAWGISDYWPQEIVGALAHEFQHMINFYQKDVLRSTSVEVWLNEMASEVTEDFVATKLNIDGPRGVSYLEGSAGLAYNTSGRLPRYCRYNYVPVVDWLAGSDETDALSSYSVNYSVGAYLARNYGGATFFKNLVQNDKSDYQAINSALTAGGYIGEDFKSVLKKWGVAVLLSDNGTTDVPSGYRYNTGGFVASTLGSIDYSLGSINMFNYHYSGLLGPQIYASLPPTDTMAGRYKTSNMFYKWGAGLSGTVSKIITLQQGTKLTVVIK